MFRRLLAMIGEALALIFLLAVAAGLVGLWLWAHLNVPPPEIIGQ